MARVRSATTKASEHRARASQNSCPCFVFGSSPPPIGQLPKLPATLLEEPPKEDITRQIGDISTMIAAKERRVVTLADGPTDSTKGSMLCYLRLTGDKNKPVLSQLEYTYYSS
jgi:hypothetical protein